MSEWTNAGGPVFRYNFCEEMLAVVADLTIPKGEVQSLQSLCKVSSAQGPWLEARCELPVQAVMVLLLPVDAIAEYSWERRGRIDCSYDPSGETR